MLRVPRSLADDSLQTLQEAAVSLHENGDWGNVQFQWLQHVGATGWTIPVDDGGTSRTTAWLLDAYQQMAAVCLTTTFVLTQFHAACQRIVTSPQSNLRSRILADLVAGRSFATVGISHLSTSRQHLRQPAVQVKVDGDGMLLDGTVPWVTAARIANLMVTGGTVEDGRQVLVALPMETCGVQVAPAARLLALTASQTASVTLNNVRLPLDYLLHGPVHQVMQGGAGGTGSVATSALALGVAERAIRLIEAEQKHRPDLTDIAVAFRQQLSDIRQDLQTFLTPTEASRVVTSEELRQRSNDLVLRTTQAALAASKGAGFVTGHPAEQAVREAMFFLVWSCPQPVTTATLQQLACLV